MAYHEGVIGLQRRSRCVSHQWRSIGTALAVSKRSYTLHPGRLILQQHMPQDLGFVDRSTR